LYGPGTGIGTALRKARLHRGKTIEEASRDTMIRAEYLQALEREAFTSLRGDVYVRGFLRSYSSYLGLNPDKVVGVYARSTGKPVTGAEPPPPRMPQPQALKSLHRRANWKLAIGLAITALVVFGAVGLLSRSPAVPGPATLQSSAPPPQFSSSVTVAMKVTQEIPTVVTVDGEQAFSGTLEQGAEKFFQGSSVIRVQMPRGGAIEIVVNGVPVGEVGDPSQPFSVSYTPQDYRESQSPPAG
jgi:cytoskeletal protein RodZ